MDNPINTKNIKSDLNTTDANSSNLQDIVKKQQKLYEDIKTLSSNINLNLDINQNNNTNNNNNNNFNDYYQLSADVNREKSQMNNKQLFGNMPRTTKSNIQSEKINELIHKFNNLYSSEKNHNTNMVSNDINMNNIKNNSNSNEDEPEMKIQDFFSINNSDLNGNFDRNNNLNNNNVSYDNIYNNKNNSNVSNKNISNKSSDNIVVSTNSTNDQNMNTFGNKKEMYNYNKRSNNYNKIRLNYFTAKNKLLNRPINIHSYAKNKSYSMTQTSKSYNAIKDKRKISSHYSNQNRDNDPDISKISEKANMVINEFKKTLMGLLYATII